MSLESYSRNFIVQREILFSFQERSLDFIIFYVKTLYESWDKLMKRNIAQGDLKCAITEGLFVTTIRPSRNVDPRLTKTYGLVSVPR